MGSKFNPNTSLAKAVWRTLLGAYSARGKLFHLFAEQLQTVRAEEMGRYN